MNMPITAIAPRFRAALGAAVLAVAFAAAVPAQAQFGGRASFGEAFQPDILNRDIGLMTQTLGLEEWQRPVVEALLQDYMTAFNTGVEALKDRMRQASTDAVKASGGNGEKILEQVMAPINGWRDEKRRMLEKFMADVKSQLGPQQLEHWPSFERALRRERMLPNGDLSGESVDLWAVLTRMQASPAELEAIKQPLTAYEEALDVALVARTNGMLKIEPELADAMRAMNYDRGAQLQGRIMDLRIAVRTANDQGIDTLSNALGARGGEFRRLALEAGYAEVFRPHPVMILMQQARALPSLTADQASQIDALMSEFGKACDDQNMRLYEAVRAEEPKAPQRRVQAMLERKSGGAATPQGSNANDPVVKARVEREKMGEPYRERLVAILNPEQRSELPGAVKYDAAAAPKSPVSGGPKGVSVEPAGTEALPEGGKATPAPAGDPPQATERPSKRRDPRSAAGKGGAADPGKPE